MTTHDRSTWPRLTRTRPFEPIGETAISIARTNGRVLLTRHRPDLRVWSTVSITLQGQHCVAVSFRTQPEVSLLELGAQRRATLTVPSFVVPRTDIEQGALMVHDRLQDLGAGLPELFTWEVPQVLARNDDAKLNLRAYMSFLGHVLFTEDEFAQALDAAARVNVAFREGVALVREQVPHWAVEIDLVIVPSDDDRQPWLVARRGDEVPTLETSATSLFDTMRSANRWPIGRVPLGDGRLRLANPDKPAHDQDDQALARAIASLALSQTLGAGWDPWIFPQFLASWTSKLSSPLQSVFPQPLLCPLVPKLSVKRGPEKVELGLHDHLEAKRVRLDAPLEVVGYQVSDWEPFATAGLGRPQITLDKQSGCYLLGFQDRQVPPVQPSVVVHYPTLTSVLNRLVEHWYAFAFGAPLRDPT